MALIQSRFGPGEIPVGGQFYTFQLDRAGRAVAEVHNLRHVECFLALEHYRRVEPLPAPKAPAPVPEKTGRKGKNTSGSGGDNGSAGQGDGGLPDGAAGSGESEEPFDDDIIRIKGIGKALKAKLAEHGVTSLRDIAGMSPETEAELDTALELHGRIAREGWIDQAQAMVPGEEDADQGEG